MDGLSNTAGISTGQTLTAPMLAQQKQNLIISIANNGYILTIGCEKFVFSSIVDVTEKVKEYFGKT